MTSNSAVRAVADTHLVIFVDDLPHRLVQDLKYRFTRPNPEYHKKAHMGLWTGDTPEELRSWEIDEQFLYLPRGAVGDVSTLLSECGFNLQVRDRTVRGEPVEFEFKGTARPYQEIATEALIEERDGAPNFGRILRGPPGSGKTVILLNAIAKIRRPAIVIVHNRALMDQWREAASKFLGIAPGNIGGGRKTTIRPLTIAMQQSIWRLNRPPWARYFGVVVGDECHHWAARTFQLTAQLFPARLRLGASANEKRKDGKEWLTTDTIGPVAHQIHKEDLIGLKRLVPVHMEIVPTDYADGLYIDSMQRGESPDWVGTITRMTRDAQRNAQILEHAKRVLAEHDTRILMLSERIEACRWWKQTLTGAGIRAGLMIGGVKNRTELERTKAGLQKGTVRVGIGTTVADEGLDIPALSHVFLTCPTHNHTKRLEQQVGRGARPWGNKNQAVAVYFWDRWMFPYYEPDDERRLQAEERIIAKLRSVVNSARVLPPGVG